MNVFPVRMVLVVLLGALAAGCSSMEYKIRESFGQQKREILVDRVGAAKDSQEEAKAQFLTALEQFKSVTGFEGGDLEARYDSLKKEFDRCNSRAEDVHKRIDAVEDVAHALFREWEDELKEYTSENLRQLSQRQLEQTRLSYESLISVMHKAEDRMDPVLASFKDQVLFLKHNLNARAISSLGGVSADLQRDIDRLVADMERAIADASAFIDSMQTPPANGS